MKWLLYNEREICSTCWNENEKERSNYIRWAEKGMEVDPPPYLRTFYLISLQYKCISSCRNDVGRSVELSEYEV